MEWKEVDNSTQRAKVPWGWLVKHWDAYDLPVHTGSGYTSDFSIYPWMMSFVFDPFHWWKG